MATGDISRGIKNRVARRIMDVGNVEVSDVEIYTWLSDACMDILTRQPEATNPEVCTSKTYDATTSSSPILEAGVDEYTLPTDFLWDRKLSYQADYSDATSPITYAKRLNIEQIGEADANQKSGAATNPYYWIWDGDLNMDVGTMVVTARIILYYVKYVPNYTVSAATTVFTPETGAIGAAADPIVSRLYFPAIEDYAVARCLEMRGDMATSQYLMQQYDARLDRIAARWRAQQNKEYEGRPGA